MSLLPIKPICPCCNSTYLISFYKQHSVPVNSVVLVTDKNSALKYPRGEIELMGCEQCGFVQNVTFDSGLVSYDDNYEETQGYSSTFSKHQLELADELISTFVLKNKHIIEIGCGKGDFLKLICSRGNNSGLGYDPTFDETRISLPEDVTIYKKKFVSDDVLENANLVCCIMTLEHIFDIELLIKNLHTSIKDPSTKLYFQVPNAQRLFDNGAFYDIYYEHCSYFTEQSLYHLFTRAGFKVLDIKQQYQGQYLGLLAEYTTLPIEIPIKEPSNIRYSLSSWKNNLLCERQKINSLLANSHQHEKSIVLWGGGSKAVSLLSIIHEQNWIDAVIDINPRKHNTFLPGTGHMVVGMDYIVQNRVDLIIIMNFVYEYEIRTQISSMDISIPTIVSLH